MSGLVGTLGRGRSAAQSDVVTRLTHLMSRPMCLAGRAEVDGRIDVACLSAADAAHLPLTTHLYQGAVGVAGVAGHVDNTSDVARHLGVAPGAGAAEVAWRLVRAEGVAGLARLLGDFALAVYDAELDRLVIACDGVGLRPLFYRVTDDAVSWCSESRPLLLRAAMFDDLDEQYIADFLSNRGPAGSPYRGVEMLAGGEALVVVGGVPTKQRHWELGPGAEIRYRSDAEYEEHFRALFFEAVRARGVGVRPVVAELSGGVDSTTIACVAELLIARGQLDAPTVTTVSYTYRDAPSSNEEAYIDDVLRSLSGANHKLRGRDYPYFAGGAAGVCVDHPTRQLMRLSLADRVRDLMRENGARVLLSGIGGDQLFWSEPGPGLPLADYLAEHRWADLARGVGAWSAQARWPMWKTLWEGGVQPYKRARFGPLFRDRIGAWFAPAFVKRVGLDERLTLRHIARFRRPTQCFQAAKIRHTMRPWAMQRITRHGPIDVRYPYLDRRLIEFAVAIPLEQMIRVGEHRSIVRRALRGFVPASVLDRRTKDGPSEAMLRALGREWPWLSRVLEQPIAADLGFIDAAAFGQELQRATVAMSSHEGNLMNTIALELWLRELAGHGDRLQPRALARADRDPREDRREEGAERRTAPARLAGIP